MSKVTKIINIKYPRLYTENIINDDLKLDAESDNGYIEYKRTLVDCNSTKMENYATQMRWRITQNTKQIATYYVGIDDSGCVIGLSIKDIILSIDNFYTITKIINASIIKIIVINVLDKLILKIFVKIKKKINDGFFVDFIDDN